MNYLAKHHKAVIAGLLLAVSGTLAACGGGGGNTTPSPVASPPPPPPPPPAAPSEVTISGAVTFETVGVDTNDFVLDLADLTTLPARGIVVRAVDASNAILDSTTTDLNGQYELEVDANTSVRIEAVAQLLQDTPGGAQWDVSVLDNTSDNAQYVLEGALASSGTADSTRDLFAPSGSDGVSAYTSARTAGPFNILDTIFSSLTLMEGADPDIIFEDLQIFWSVNNRIINDDEEFDIEEGNLNSSAFTFINGDPTILILGDIDTDTDEYDEHVIAHEFGHFFQETVSRDDSIGGAHSLASRLDPRVAFSEGFGNALSAIILDDPLYIDAGFGSDGGFAFNVDLNTIGQIIENNSGTPAAGWYGESSTQSIIYDIFDTNNDGVDSISAGFQPLYDAFVNPTFVDSNASTTMFSYVVALLEDPAITAADLDPLLDFQDINGTGIFGIGETNDGDIPTSLPVFATYTVGDPPIEICSLDDAGTQNNIGVRTLISVSIPSAGTFTFTMERISGEFDRNPQFLLFNQGGFFGGSFGNNDDGVTDIEVEVIPSDPNFVLPAGEYIIDAFDDNNLDNDEEDVPGDACYNFSVQ